MAIEVCDICGEQVEISSSQQAPESCPVCFNPWSPMRSTKQNAEEKCETTIAPSALIITCQKSGKSIRVKPESTVVLGRDAFGAEIFTQPQISRKHCSISWCDSVGFLVSDLGSTHGTYLGVHRTDCHQNPKQVLEDGEILYLARELYTIRVEQKPAIQETTTTQTSESPAKPPSCGTERSSDKKADNFNEKSSQCENCNSIIEITKDLVDAPFCPECNCYNHNWQV